MRNVTRGEGADGFFLKTLTECIGRVGAIDPAKAQALRDAFHSELFKEKRALENPKDFMRHEGTILERMFKNPVAVVPPPEPITPKADVIVPSGSEVSTSEFDFDFDIEPDPVNPYVTEGGPLAMALDEWATSRKHPFVRTIIINKVKYTVVGTAVVHGTKESVNINCTTGNFKKIRECDEQVLVHFNGRAVSLSQDTPNGTAFFVWLCHFKPGRVFRFWMNRNKDGVRKDDPNGSFRVLITDDQPGWRKVAA
jgi:hypothetical protein